MSAIVNTDFNVSIKRKKPKNGTGVDKCYRRKREKCIDFISEVDTETPGNCKRLSMLSRK